MKLTSNDFYHHANATFYTDIVYLRDGDLALPLVTITIYEPNATPITYFPNTAKAGYCYAT